MTASSHIFGFLSSDMNLQEFRSSDGERDNFEMLENKIHPLNKSGFYEL
jgi:hypothetical protein